MRVRLVAVALLASISAAALAQADVFATLGSNETEAREQIFSSFSSGFVTPRASRDLEPLTTAISRN